MGLVAMGISHKTAPVDLREHLTIPETDIGGALTRLKDSGEIAEAVILSTCNRLEIYGRPVNTRAQTLVSINKFFSELYRHPALGPAIYQFEANHAVEHLFKVAAGLDSLVVGESEILGQVKSAYRLAHERGATGKITNVLFQRAIFVGKHVRTHTKISEGASSVGSVAVHLAERIFGSLTNHRTLLVGAGKMAEVTARHLLSQKTGELVILNRTPQKAEELAKQLNGRAGSLVDLPKELAQADIVITSTAATEPIITLPMVQAVLKTRRGRSLYFVDIAVPRDVDPQIHKLDNVYVYNIDDLKSIVDESLARRQNEVLAAENIVRSASKEFYEWITAVLEGRPTGLKHNISEESLS
jgi:glutamyl-tRNA reductase